MHKRKHLKSILAGLNKKRTMSKNPFNQPPLVNVTGQNIDKPRRSERLLETPCINYNEERINKEKGKLKKKENDP